MVKNCLTKCEGGYYYLKNTLCFFSIRLLEKDFQKAYTFAI